MADQDTIILTDIEIQHFQSKSIAELLFSYATAHILVNEQKKRKIEKYLETYYDKKQTTSP
jgi:hypothetical protein